MREGGQGDTLTLMGKELEERPEQEIVADDEGAKEAMVAAKKGSAFSFRYSYKSMTSVGGKTHIHSKEHRFSDGKIETEELEGTVDGSVYDNAASQVQKAFLDQMSTFMKAWTPLLPPFFAPGGNDDDKERG